MSSPEEFPRFTTFWLERPLPDSGLLTVYALLDSPSVAGAFRFYIRPAAVLTMDVDSAIYPRQEIERIGIAPLTSMYLHGENDRRVANDWRNEVHDSDELAMWRGNGEWIWRPLTNPVAMGFNAYADENPRGFGLLQRDRNFDHYQDDGVFYERRPSLWVEPKSSWDKGSVQLVELPTPDETNVTSSRSGILRNNRDLARNYYSATDFIGERACRPVPLLAVVGSRGSSVYHPSQCRRRNTVQAPDLP